MSKGNILFVREKHTDRYTCISNKCLQDIRLSMKARGLLVQLLSLPESWILYKSEIERYNRDHKHAINSAITKLESLGYLLSKKINGNIIYKIIEAPEGTVSLFDIISADNQNLNDVFGKDCDDFQTNDNRKSELSNAENQPLLINNLNNNKLTTTKAVSQSLFSNEELKKTINETYGFEFSEDFYSKLSELNKEREINPLEYTDWLINQKGTNAATVSNYVYKAAGNLNIINEYCRYKKEQEEIRKNLFEPVETVVCPECNHIFEGIDFITCKCQCGLSLNEIMTRKRGSNE